MATRYVIQHRTNRRFLVVRPSLQVGLHETPDVAQACSFATMMEATWELIEFAEFEPAWEVVAIVEDGP